MWRSYVVSPRFQLLPQCALPFPLPGIRIQHFLGTIATVVVPAAYRGIATGMILGVARIAGETAPLLFTSLNNQFWSTGLDQPTASLPVMVFTHAIAAYDDWHRQAWAAGLVLLLGVLVANIAARLILSRGISVQR